ncbi:MULTISPECIES: DUF4376 domain-containing protein [Campylobacter]|uniref:DUF4376 domain-containing protein n=1 Tax=Campylobacter TaxID=194 RepID=UPI0013069B1A|nr:MULTISPECIES: DUF4376 domain-containing protein [Campylobacter]MBT0822091.1 DUF4376 domain-containing protein [Campylobacter lari]MBT0829554.1 DUF4376 domain-containing protein [Campylobacter lari]MCV3397347.1 DUF4376 domain-containing protein [Campylobacter sp. RKI_CA19_01116]
MIITKENGVVYRELNNDIINFHKENKMIIAFINRPANEIKDDNGNIIYTDDITPQEIENGTKAVKEHCLANKNENLYFEYLLAISQEDEKLNVLKEKKKHEIQTKRDEALESGLVYNEHTFQTRKEDKQNIIGAATNLMFDMQSETNSISEIIWIDINDKKATFTPQDFLKFASSVAYHTQEIIFKANALKERIEQAESEQDLEAIVWED